MFMKRIFFIAILVITASLLINAQPATKSTFKNYKPGFYQNSILKDIRVVEEKNTSPEVSKRFQADLAGLDLPNKVDLYTNHVWYNAPLSQGNTGTCWCFSATSYFESEIVRLGGPKIKLSEIYTVYWEYVEKARRFVKERGNSAFEEGSEANAVARIWKSYGVIPAEAYTGLTQGRKYHNHEPMIQEMKTYLASVKSNNAWNESTVISTIRTILDFYLGAPPSQVVWNGKTYTPVQFLSDVTRLKLDDYVDILSYLQAPFWEKVEYKVTDNWWHCSDYYNVPLNDFMLALKSAIRKGYSIAIGGDVSEAGLDKETQCAIIPTFDIPSASIDDNARQFRVSNGTTGDDHGMHLVGYLEKDGKDWYLIKDSSSGSRNNSESAPEFGFYFFNEDFVKLKMLDFTVHKDAVKELLGKFKD
jgi:bleomycin hydrolase